MTTGRSWTGTWPARRTRRVLVCIPFALLGLFPCSGDPFQKGPAKRPAVSAPGPAVAPTPAVQAGVRIMLELDLDLKAKEFIVDGSMPATVTVRNASNGLVLVHDTESRRPFEYEFRARDGSTRVMSANLYAQRSGPQPAPAVAAEMQPLAAGESRAYPEDITSYSLESLRPGDYLVTARYPLNGQVFVSKPRPARVVAPRVESFAETASLNRARLASVLVHRGEGRVSIYQRESTDYKPAFGVWHERYATEASHIGSVAVATEVDADLDWRYLAWLENDRFRAAVGWGKELQFILPPSPVGLASPRLLETGWQSETNPALFLVAGMEGGRARLKLATLADRVAPKYETFDLAASMPEAMAASYQQQRGSILVVWAARHNGSTALEAKVITPGSPDSGRSVVLMERPEPVAALAIEPVTREAIPVLRVLYGPDSRGHLTFVEMRVARERSPKEWELDAPPDLPKDAVWTIGPETVLVRAGGRLLMSRTEAPAWHSLAESAAGVNYPRVADLGACWATWVDAEKGVRYKLIE